MLDSGGGNYCILRGRLSRDERCSLIRQHVWELGDLVLLRMGVYFLF